jgi:pimeloyl-ACP methyl ester carboxylesterase
MLVSKSVRTTDRSALSIRTLTLVLTFIIGMTNVSTYASETANQRLPAQPQTLINEQESSIEPGDVSERFEIVNQIHFAPCPENPRFECGTLNLPVDYNKPHRGLFKMAVIRAKATNPAKRIGVLFSNPGGPGSSGVDFILGGDGAPAFERLRERFDMVSFDVRGSHRSQAVRCEIEPVGEPASLDDATLIAFFDDFSRRVAKACLDQNGPFILSMSTNNIARDMDVLRRALGERKITYAGLSFGTTVGAVYASLFPKRVRGMLLDSGVGPEFRDQRVELRSEQAASFEGTFHRLDQLCRKNATCRLQSTGLLAAFDQVIAQLKAQPIPFPGGVVLKDGDVVDIVATMLSTEPLWPLIIDAIADGAAGDFTLLFQLLPFRGGIPTIGGSTFGAFTVIQCNDFGTRRSAAEYLPVDEVVGALYPRLEGRFTVAGSTAICAAWPSKDVPIIRNVKNQVDTSILLIGNDFDPNTPLTWTRSLARALGMERSIMRYQGGGHLAYAFFGNNCVDRAGDEFLFDLTVPAEGFACPAQPVGFTPQTVQGSSKRVMSTRERELLLRMPAVRR